MPKNKNTPALRFAGFSGEWEEKELLDIVDILDGDRGKNYPNGDDFSSAGHTLFLSATNVTKDGFKFDETQYITEAKSLALGNGKVEINDVILTSRGTLGNLVLYNNDIHKKFPYVRINSGMLILRKLENESADFILQYLKSPIGSKHINLISFGSAQPQLTKKEVSKYNLKIPQFDEQTKIGEFCTTLDTLISLQQREYDKTVNIKKAMLQKMFPKAGADKPEIRFAGFSGGVGREEVGNISRSNN